MIDGLPPSADMTALPQGMGPEPTATPPPQDVPGPPPIFPPEVAEKVKQYIGLADPYSKEFGALMQNAIDSWNQWFSNNGLKRQCLDNFAAYHNAALNGADSFSGTAFRIVGDNGELIEIRVNEMRNLITHLVNLTVSQPPAFVAKARDADPQTIEAAQDLDGILQFYMESWENSRLEKQITKAVEQSCFLPFGAVLCEWDSQAGPAYISDELGRVVRQGDISVTSLSVFDVIFDPLIDDEGKLDWIICREWWNKYELAARFPDQAVRILNLPDRADVEGGGAWGSSSGSNQVCVWKFYHKPTIAVPEGRFAMSVDPDVILYDGANPYGQIPLFFIRCADGHGTIYGYPVANDILPINIATNMMFSAMTSNYAAGGTQNIAVKAGDEPAVSALSGGMRVIEYTDTPPQAMTLVQNAPGSFDFIGLLRSTNELLSGINSAARGDPDANVKSGKMQGMLQALAIQFANKLQRNYAGATKGLGNFMLKVFRQYATSERVTQLIGKDRVARSVTWTGDRFANIDSVVVEQVDPAMKTVGYKLQQAEFLVNSGMITDPATYVSVSRSGNLDVMIEPELARLALIRAENSDLMRGIECPVLITDNHKQHNDLHDLLLNSPAVRRDQAMVKFVLAHKQQHIEFEAMLGQPSSVAAEGKQAQPAGEAEAPKPEATEPASTAPQPPQDAMPS